MNLYDELGLPPNASEAEIKAAHRRAVKEHHPDAGGDKAKFQAIQLAYDTLKDKKRRQHYDRTGETADAAAPDETLQAITMIFEQMVSEMLQDGVSIETQDLRQLLSTKMGEKVGEITRDCNNIERQLKKAGSLLKRWKRKHKAKGPDIMGDTLRRRERDLKDDIKRRKDAIRIWNKALALVNSYDYEFDPEAPQAQGNPWMMGSFIRIDLGRTP